MFGGQFGSKLIASDGIAAGGECVRVELVRAEEWNGDEVEAPPEVAAEERRASKSCLRFLYPSEGDVGRDRLGGVKGGHDAGRDVCGSW